MDKENFNKKKIINQIYKKLGFSKNYSSKILDVFFEVFVNELIKSENVKISSFGTFKVNKKKERIGRNPKTKIEAMISARKVIKFKPSLELKNKINS
tara:strand:- start:1532 stop:1822 length:291 start_codon:yes stop_codon:yes gene_type:complete